MARQLRAQWRRPSGPAASRGPVFPGSGGWDREGPRPAGSSPSAGTWLLLAAVGVLFLGFTSSYLSRRTAGDWTPVAMPGLLWVTTLLLVASSAVLEWGRPRGRGAPGRLRVAVNGAAALGLLFVLGQLGAWRELAAAGVFLASNPHASFFYVLTAVHGVHVLAGLAWLLIGAARLRVHHPRAVATVRSGAIYWHFVGILWIYLWVLLFWI